MKLLFRSKEFFDGSITCTGRVYLYEVEDVNKMGAKIDG